MAASQGNYEIVKMLVSSTHHPDVNARANVSVYINTKTKCSVCTIGKDNVLFITGCTDVCYHNFLPLNRAANLENHLHFYLYRILQWTRSPCNDVNCMCPQLSTGPLLCAHEAS